MIPVMLLMNCSSLDSVVNKLICGARFHQGFCFFQCPGIFFTLFQNSIFHMRFFFHLSNTLKMQLSYSTEFSPPPTPNKKTFHWCFVSICVSQCLLFVCPAKTALLNSDWRPSQLSKGCGLTERCHYFFVLFPTKPMFTTTPISFSAVQKCAFQIQQRQFCCVLIIFKFLSLVFSWT